MDQDTTVNNEQQIGYLIHNTVNKDSKVIIDIGLNKTIELKIHDKNKLDDNEKVELLTKNSNTNNNKNIIYAIYSKINKTSKNEIQYNNYVLKIDETNLTVKEHQIKSLTLI